MAGSGGAWKPDAGGAVPSGSLPVRPGEAVRAGEGVVEVRAVAAHPDADGQHITLTVVLTGRRTVGVPAWLERADGHRWFLERQAEIGRDPQNDIRLADYSVSRFHARLERSDDGYLISDNASRNGTWVNGRRIDAARALRPGDRIALGDTELTFGLDEDGAITESIRSEETTRQHRPAPSAAPPAPPDAPLRLDGEVRVVAILYADLKGYTRLSGDLPPDQLAAAMRECYRRLSQVAEYFGGYVNKYLGDGLMVLFGAPTARGDDAERAARAGLAMQQAMAPLNGHLTARWGLDVALRVGVATGEVAVLTIGNQVDALGNAANLAKRLETACATGGVLVCEDTYRLSRAAIRYAARPPLRAKNIDAPVNAYDALGLADELPDPRLDAGVLGRGEPLTRLAGLLADAARGPQAATLLGATGVGKSRLLAEWQRAQAGAARWVVVRCAEPDRRAPYAVLRRLVRALLQDSGAAAPPPADLSATFWEQPHNVWLIRNLLHDPFLNVGMTRPEELLAHFARKLADDLHDLARQRPVVLALDDAQWADDATLDALDAAFPQLRRAPVVYVALARPSWARRWAGGGQRLRLGELDRADCGRLVALLLRSEAIDPAAIELLTRRSDGNPRLLEELVRAYLDDGRLREEGGRWTVRGDAPGAGAGGALGLRAVVQSRLDSLPADDRWVLQVAAAIGPACAIGALARTLETDLPLRDILRRLVAHGFLDEQLGDGESSYAFRHADIRVVALNSLFASDRERLRERLARAGGA